MATDTGQGWQPVGVGPVHALEEDEGDGRVPAGDVGHLVEVDQQDGFLFRGEGDAVVLGVDQELRDQCVPDLDGMLGA